MPKKPDESMALSLVKQIVDKSVDGNNTLNISSAKDLALEYINNKSFKSDLERIEAMIKWETTKNFASGFTTGLGGFITLPVTLPTALVSSWIIQARLCAAIAYICGYDIDDDKVRTAIILVILGDGGKEILKSMGVDISREVSMQLIKNLTPKIIKEINKRVGFKLITNTSQKSILSQASKFIPFVGGVVSGSIDAISCQAVGLASKSFFFKEKV